MTNKYKYIFLPVVLLMFSMNAMTQGVRQEARDLNENYEQGKPKDTKVADVENFKQASFTLLKDLIGTDAQYLEIKSSIASYRDGVAPQMDQVEADIQNLKKLMETLPTYDEKVLNLLTTGKDVAENAKNIKPATKVPAAVKSSKISLNAANVSKDYIVLLTEEMGQDLSYLTGLVAE